MKLLGISFFFFFNILNSFCQCGEYLDFKYKADSCYKKNNFERSAFYYKRCLDYSEKQRSDYYYLSRSLIEINDTDSALHFYEMAANKGLRYQSLKDFYRDSIFQKNDHIKEWKAALGIVRRNTEELEQSQKMYLPLLKILLERKLKDQKYRTPELTKLPQNIKDSLWQLQKKTDIDNQLWLKTEISKNGWPGLSKVGMEGDNAAWLIAQHSDNDMAFQKYCLEALKKAWSIKETQLKNIAYLEDRIFVNNNKEQMYGTQFEIILLDNKTEDLKLRPTINIACLNKRRNSMGLEPIEDYIDYAKKRYIHQ